ncbi:MAG: hypothetical protein FWB80_14425 [Defluviitaleaceae bacterium]|nr:hypothetical protein [Defluviitaleaceae bacterium]
MIISSKGANFFITSHDNILTTRWRDVITPDGKHYVPDWSHVTKGNASADDSEYCMKTFCGKAPPPM